MENNILSPKETYGQLKEYNIDPSAGPESLKWKLSQVFHAAVQDERDKLTYRGLYHNAGNRKAFVERITGKFGKKNVSQYSFSDKTEVRVTLAGNDLRIAVKEDEIEIHVDYGVNFKFGLHSNFYDELIHFLFDEDGGFYKLFVEYNRLAKSLQYYSSLCEEFSKPGKFLEALNDKASYDEFRNRYLETSNTLKPLTEYLMPIEWDALLRLHTIEPALREIDSIQNSISRKPEKAISKKKSYEKAIVTLEGADKLGLLSPDEHNMIVPWAEFISSTVDTGAEDYSGQNGYMSMVTSVFNQKIEMCRASSTAYMRKKQSKMEADIRFCQQLKAEYDIDCFIDRSQFSSSVDHFNIVTADNMVWIFRIPRAEPSKVECERYIHIMMALDAIAETVGKKVKLTDAGRRRSDQRFCANAPGINKSLIDPLVKKLKFIKGGRLEMNNSFISIVLPVGNMEWKIPMRIKVAEDTINKILPLLQQYHALYKKGQDIDVKGIYKERVPHL